MSLLSMTCDSLSIVMVEKVGDRKNLWCKCKTLRGAKEELGYLLTDKKEMVYSFKNTVRKLSQIFIRLNEVLQCNDFKVILRRAKVSMGLI